LHADVFELNRGLWRTIRDLTLKPGATIRAYLDGDTKKYYSPVKYLAVVAALLYLLLSFDTGDTASNVPDAFSFETWKTKFFSAAIAPFSGASFVEILSLPTVLLNGQLLLYFFIFLPFTSLTSRFIFRTLNFTEFVITWMFLWAHVLGLLLAIFPIIWMLVALDADGTISLAIISLVSGAITITTFTRTFRYLTKGRWIFTFLKMILAVYSGYLLCAAAVWLIFNLVKVA